MKPRLFCPLPVADIETLFLLQLPGEVVETADELSGGLVVSVADGYEVEVFSEM